MKPETWEKLKEHFAWASELSGKDLDNYLSSINENDLSAELRKLLDANRRANDFIDIPFAVRSGFVPQECDDDLIGKQIDDYVILEKIGEGGMGTVYCAEHAGEGFAQRVALKLIKRGMDTNAVLKRFLRERQILAGLEHPNIARMLDGGSTKDGLPYFVMEYVDGRPIRDHCDELELDVNERLRLIQKVCDALRYAHQKLVIHRDLKPSNILVTPDGEPKLLDFGIAKLLDPDWNASTTSATETQFRVLTPEYASPEHFLGEPTTTASDVYSIGVILYEIITGTRPYEVKRASDRPEQSAVAVSDPKKPSTMVELQTKTATGERSQNTKRKPIYARQLRGDLDNIILKAIRREPERRYQTALELSEDIRRYLQGLPVGATADSRMYRFKKYYRRNRTGVLAAGFASVVLLGSTGVSLWQYRTALIERERALRRFDDVRGLASTMIFDHYERIKNLPGATEARERLISDALSYLDKLARESEGDPQLQRELVAAYRRLADVQGSTGEGGNLGKLGSARSNLLRALEIQEKLVNTSMTTIEDKRVLGKLLFEVGLMVENENAPFEKDTYFMRAYEIFTELEKTNPDRKQAKSDLATANWHLAMHRRPMGDNAAAISHLQRSIELYDELANEFPDEPKHRRNWALSNKNLGSIYQLLGDNETSLKHYLEALSADKANAAREPNNVEAQMDLSFSHRSVASAFYRLKRFEEALGELTKAQDIQERLLSQDAKNAFIRKSLYRTWAAIAEWHRDNGKLSDAELSFARAEELLAGLEKDAISAFDKGNIATNRMSKALFHEKKADLLKGQQRRNELIKAISELRSANTTFSELMTQKTLDPAFKKNADEVKKSLVRMERLL